MIEDLEGATSEPPRRRQVMVVSLATAGGAVMLFAALVLSPLGLADLPRAFAPAPSASAASARAVSVPSILTNIGLLQERGCQPSPAVLWAPIPNMTTEAVASRPYSIAVAIDAESGRALSPLVIADGRTRWMIVTCATSEPPTRLVDVRTIPR